MFTSKLVLTSRLVQTRKQVPQIVGLSKGSVDEVYHKIDEQIGLFIF
ncbi:hypothetical protein M918_00465 [Clostridium sp. BL8]|nr:hypothetical protein M918_00465 [Clostridium sp. BL8]